MKAILLAMLLMAATIYATDPRTGMADYTKPIAVIENGQIYNVYPGTQSPRYDQAPTNIYPEPSSGAISPPSIGTGRWGLVPIDGLDQ